MKISNEVVEELKKIRNALDNMYDVLNITLFKKKFGKYPINDFVFFVENI